MKLNNLCAQLVVSPNNLNVIAAGPLAKQPGTMPYRVVLIQYDDGSFSVHKEIFGDLPTGGDAGRSSLLSGHYFAKHELVQATLQFADAVSKMAGELGTLYR